MFNFEIVATGVSNLISSISGFYHWVIVSVPTTLLAFGNDDIRFVTLEYGDYMVVKTY